MDAHELTTQITTGVFQVDDDREERMVAIEGFDQCSGVPNTSSGQRVNSFNALEYSAVWQAVSLVSEDVSKLALGLTRRRPDGTKELLYDSPLTDLVSKFPSLDINAQKFWQRTVEHLMLWGNAFIWVVKDERTGDPKTLVHLLPNMTSVTNLPSATNANGDIQYRTVLYGGAGPTFLFNPEELIVLEGLQDLRYAYGAAGVNTTAAARDSIGVGKAQEDYAGRFFASGGRGGGYLEIPQGASKRPADNLVRGLRDQFEDPQASFKMIPLYDGAKFTPSQISPEQSQMTDSMDQSLKNVARFYNIPASLLGVSDASSYGEKEQDANWYLDRCLSGYLAKIRSECDMKLLTAPQRRRHCFEYDTSRLVRPGYVPLLNGLSVGVAGGIYTPNEARAELNLPPVPGGDQIKDVTTPEPAAVPASEEQPGEQPADEAPAEDEPDAGRARFGRVLFSMTSHAREQAERGNFGRWIKGQLPSHRERAFALLGSESIVDEFIEATRDCETYTDVDRIAEELEVKYGNARALLGA